MTEHPPARELCDRCGSHHPQKPCPDTPDAGPPPRGPKTPPPRFAPRRNPHPDVAARGGVLARSLLAARERLRRPAARPEPEQKADQADPPPWI